MNRSTSLPPANSLSRRRGCHIPMGPYPLDGHREKHLSWLSIHLPWVLENGTIIEWCDYGDEPHIGIEDMDPQFAKIIDENFWDLI